LAAACPEAARLACDAACWFAELKEADMAKKNTASKTHFIKRDLLRFVIKLIPPSLS